MMGVVSEILMIIAGNEFHKCNLCKTLVVIVFIIEFSAFVH